MKPKTTKKAILSAAGTVLGAAIILGAPLEGEIARAQSGNPYRHWGVAKGASERSRASRSRAYVPARGGSTRKAIADGLRRDVGKFSGLYVVFNFNHLKVNGVWAYAETAPESPDGKNKYEPVSALLKRSGSVWNVVGRGVTDDETDEATALCRLKNKFPGAPRDIFPH